MGKAFMRGLAGMFDFFGVLSDRPRTVEEDMALAWEQVLAVVKPPPVNMGEGRALGR